MSRAALVSAWGRRRHPAYAYVPGVVQAAPVTVVDGGDGGPIGLTVEIYLGDAGWEDITSFVYYRDRVRITRGKPDETSKIQPQTCQLTINNRDGRFSPRNPLSPYYGLIGRNTQLRVSRMQNGVRRYRFVGEVVSWPSTWDISGSDVYVPLQGAGMLRRLQQGTSTIGSAMYRAYALGESATLNPVAYWPCEDGSTATQFAPGIAGVGPMTFNGSPQLASSSAFVCSDPLPVVNGSQWVGTVPAYSGGTDNVLRFLMATSSSGEANNAVVARMYTNGTVKRMDLVYTTGGALTAFGYDASGATLFTLGPFAFAQDGTTRRVSIALRTSGSDVEYEVQTLDVGASGGLGTSGVLTGAHIGAATRVEINPLGQMTGSAVGHVSYQPVWDTLFDLANQLNAWSGEQPAFRFLRLCTEEAVPRVSFTYPGILMGGNGVTMGYETDDTLGNLLQQTADTDTSLIFETADQLALAFRARLALSNQNTANNPRRGLTLDYARNQLSGPLNPTDDDAYTRNDVTAQRISGSFARAVDTDPTDPLSTNAPPTGVGGYATSYSLSVGADAALTDHAHWRLHMGTVDEPRYPQIPLNLRHPEFTGNVDLLNQALTMDIGDLVVVNNPPPWMPPDPIRQILQGYSETLGVYEHDMVLNCSPASPHTVGILEDPVLSRADTDGSTLASALSAPLNSNAFFATGVSDWAANSCTVAQVGTSGSATPFPGGWPGYGALITANGGSAVGIMQPSAAFRVSPNQTYNISVLVYYPSAAHTVELGIEWRDASNTLISTGSTFTTVPANTLTAISLSFTAPSTAALADPVIGLGGTPANGDTLYATAVVVWQGSMTVASTNPLLPLWTTNPSAFPFDIACGGERLTVTAITGASSPQAFTAARAVNGVLKPQTPGTDVRLWQPTIVSL